MKKIKALIFILFLFPHFISCKNAENESAAKENSDYIKNFSLPSLDGNENIEINDFKGKPMIVNFWASWCAPCRQEMPFFEETWRKYEAKGVVFLGIDVLDQEKNAKEFLSQLGISYVNLYDQSGEVANEYGVFALPVTLFIDKKGKIIRKSYGGFVGEEDEKKFVEYVEELVQ
ncbi:MAG TPA: TlpA disulfide reductase family protein [Thermodesulfobacteriota bacterium]|nr:TlpA disulfide reductase family protein [Thermodesulfobacteriota bacterium]